MSYSSLEALQVLNWAWKGFAIYFADTYATRGLKLTSTISKVIWK
jgi:hypothetical protein